MREIQYFILDYILSNGIAGLKPSRSDSRAQSSHLTLAEEKAKHYSISKVARGEPAVSVPLMTTAPGSCRWKKHVGDRPTEVG